MKQAHTMLHHVHFSGNSYDSAKGAHALIIVTEWDAFSALHSQWGAEE